MTVVGRPNVGKSTLDQPILGTKVTITSPRPNTTRRSVRGVLHRPGLQAVFVDTPGLHRPRTALGTRLNEQIGEALDDIDVVVPVLDATASIGPGRPAACSNAPPPRAGRAPVTGAGLRRLSRLLLVVVNKVDKASPGPGPRSAWPSAAAPPVAVEGPSRAGGHRPGRSTSRVSAATGQGVDALVDAVLDLLPVGPPYFPEDMVTDVSEGSGWPSSSASSCWPPCARSCPIPSPAGSPNGSGRGSGSRSWWSGSRRRGSSSARAGWC